MSSQSLGSPAPYPLAVALTPDEPALVSSRAAAGQDRPARSRAWRSTQHWTRWLHVYTSMIALLVVLFFGITGVTLNHPEWTFGMPPRSTVVEGSLPDTWRSEDGAVDFLAVSEYVRSEHDVRGSVTDYGSDATEGFVSYRAPGYGADLFVDLEDGSYRLNVESQGFVGVLNDLHKGRDADSSWGWLIDASGVFLVVIAVTGLGLQLLLPKRRRSALLIAGVGVLGLVVLGLVAIK